MNDKYIEEARRYYAIGICMNYMEEIRNMLHDANADVGIVQSALNVIDGALHRLSDTTYRRLKQMCGKETRQ